MRNVESTRKMLTELVHDLGGPNGHDEKVLMRVRDTLERELKMTEGWRTSASLYSEGGGEWEVKILTRVVSYDHDHIPQWTVVLPGEETDNVIRRMGGKIMYLLYADSHRQDPRVTNRRHVERARIEEIFGDEHIYVEEVPNEYEGGSWLAEFRPWFVVTTRVGRFKVGWRKRVIHLDWSGTIVGRCGEDLFPDECVTRGGNLEGNRCYIHAYSYEKATEYVHAIMRESGT